jgi:hypothetical protein
MDAITLTKAERMELTRRSKSRTGRAEDARRARVVLLLAEGHTWDEICERVDCSRGFVASWTCKLIHSQRRFAPRAELSDKPGQRRPLVRLHLPAMRSAADRDRDPLAPAPAQSATATTRRMTTQSKNQNNEASRRRQRSHSASISQRAKLAVECRSVGQQTQRRKDNAYEKAITLRRDRPRDSHHPHPKRRSNPHRHRNHQTAWDHHRGFLPWGLSVALR